MRQQQSFTPIGPATTAQAPAGGSVAVANPAAGTAANGLLVSNPGGVAWFCFAGAVNTAPAPLNGGGGGPGGLTTINPGGQLLVTDAASLAAPMVQVSGLLALTPVTIAGNLTVINS